MLLPYSASIPEAVAHLGWGSILSSHAGPAALRRCARSCTGEAGETLRPALVELNQLLDLLIKNRQNLQAMLSSLAPIARGLAESVAGGPFFTSYVANFTPDFTDPLDSTGPNNSADVLTVLGTAGDDHITVSGSGANITIAGLTPTVTPVNLRTQDPLQPDLLQINTLAGRDTVDSSGLQPGLVQLVVL